MIIRGALEIEGEFVIERVDTTVPDGFRVRLKSVDGEMTLSAGVQDALISQEQREVIQSAEWGKVPLRVKLDAKERRGLIIEATIREVEAIEPD